MNELLLSLFLARIEAGEDVAENENPRDHLIFAAGNGDPVHEVCISHRIPRSWESQGLNKKKKQTHK